MLIGNVKRLIPIALLLAILPARATPHLRDADSYPKAARAYLEAEQHANDLALMSEAYIAPSDSTLPIEFRPESSKAFRVPYIPIPISEMHLLGIQGDARFLFDGTNFRFLVHPASLSLYRQLILKYGIIEGDYWAASTSSARSLVLWSESEPDLLVSVKLSVAALQSGRTREVWPAEALHAVLVSQLLHSDLKNAETETGLAAIPEAFAAIPKAVPAGLIIKRLSKTDLAFRPVFAAFSSAGRSQPSFLETVAKKERRKIFDVSFDFANAMLKAISEHYLRTGVIPEAHSQNMMFRRLSGSLSGSWAFRFRDLSGAAVNYEIRQERGLDSSAVTSVADRPEFDPAYEVDRGLTYFQKTLTLHFYRGIVSSIDRAFKFNGELELKMAHSIQDRLDAEVSAAKKRRPARSLVRTCEGLFKTAN
ncbi:hypothetical protein BH10BDE1_BH10BDE1_05700 [soil metagenome]